MPWYYLVYDGNGNANLGGYADTLEEIQNRINLISANGGNVSAAFQAADGYQSQFAKRKAIVTINMEGETVETDL